MTARLSSATAEEETELRVLREQAAATGREFSQTAAALAGRLAEAGGPRQWAGRKAADAGARARQAALRAAARAVQPLRPARAGWPKLVMTAGATTGILVIVAVAVTWQHRRHG